MPKVDMKRDLLFKRLGKTYTQEEFENLCFEFGLELDDVLSEKLAVLREQKSESKAEGLSEEIIYKLDIPANRYDLLCIEGVVRGLKIFKNEIQPPVYKLSAPAQRQTITIKPDTQKVRKHIVGAVLRNITISQEAYDSFIDLQDKLHQNICRKRTLVAIGTHDLDTVKGPFIYDAKAPKDIKFRPLRAPEEREYTSDELLTAYESDPQLKAYVPILKGKEVYPVVLDSNGVVLSLPPIINGYQSRISTKTKNVFIECTATDLTKAKIVLNILVCMFSEYCAEPFTVEPVDVITQTGEKLTYPDFGYRTENVQASTIIQRMGLPKDLAPASLAQYLTRMQMKAEVDKDGKTLNVIVPPTRPDVIHECDIWEDCAIAYGFNKIVWTVPSVSTVAKQLPINKLTDQLRAVIAQAGYREALTFALCRHDDNFKLLRRPEDSRSAVVISNPATSEFQEARCNLLSGLLKTLFYNMQLPLPLKVFEISDVVLKDGKTDTGARNHRRLGAIICNKTASFELVQGLLDRVMKMLAVPHVSVAPAGETRAYEFKPSQDPAFFGDLAAADIFLNKQRVGVIGIVHPEVLANYELKNPCAALELDLEVFL